MSEHWQETQCWHNGRVCLQGHLEVIQSEKWKSENQTFQTKTKQKEGGQADTKSGSRGKGVKLKTNKKLS